MAHVEMPDGYGRIDASEWDSLLAPDDSPFLEHAFLLALEETGCASPRTGWTPRPVLVRDDEGRLAAAAPAWVKTHSMGEFVYDHAWADAVERAGRAYYPKLVVAVPFTPVTGRRLLVRADRPEAWTAALVDGLRRAAAGCHGLHVLFDKAAEAAVLEALGLFPRLQFQFHWRNEGYDRFDDWISGFRSKARNKLRRERREVARFRFTVGTDPTPDELDVLHAFYTDTCRRFGPWGHAHLSRELFRRLGERWGHRLHVVLAHDEHGVAGGALNVVKGDRLYGRTWGCREEQPFLHFEVCYYRAIEYCIEHRLAAFEPGHGGGHKYRRGFSPTLTWSNHAFPDPQVHEGLRRFAAAEARAVREQVDALRALSPFREA